MNNSIFVIKPYRWNNTWVFDDPAVGLVKEPFVSGADTIIDVATCHIPNAGRGFFAFFSASPFPDAQIVLERVGEESGGNVYRWAEKNMEGWLCPALLRYLPEAPAKLFVQVKAAGCSSFPLYKEQEIGQPHPADRGSGRVVWLQDAAAVSAWAAAPGRQCFDFSTLA